jgi:hypothetical protein
MRAPKASRARIEIKHRMTVGIIPLTKNLLSALLGLPKTLLRDSEINLQCRDQNSQRGSRTRSRGDDTLEPVDGECRDTSFHVPETRTDRKAGESLWLLLPDGEGLEAPVRPPPQPITRLPFSGGFSSNIISCSGRIYFTLGIRPRHTGLPGQVYPLGLAWPVRQARLFVWLVGTTGPKVLTMARLVPRCDSAVFKVACLCAWDQYHLSFFLSDRLSC